MEQLNEPNLLKKTLVTSDIALGFTSVKRPKTSNNRKVFVNFRDWFDSDVKERALLVIEKIVALGHEVEFISTCQGISSYRDDSKLHDEIINLYQQKHGNINYLTANRAKYSSENLISYLSEFGSYYIGMRLHMSISALLAGLPVLNFGYEPKNIGVLSSIGLEQYAADFFGPIEVMESMIEDMLDGDYSEKTKEVHVALTKGRELFERSFLTLNKEMELF